jgi:NAD(P)H dehydrogenase (quinone)
MNKILVTGASGHLGTAVVQTLSKKISPSLISVITRDLDKRNDFETKGFNAFLGNYTDVGSLELAMQGVDTVLLISAGDQGDRMQEHKNVIDAALRMGVKNLAYTSRCLRDRTTLVNKLMQEHFDTEDYIRSKGLNYIFFRNILYMDAIHQFVGGIIALERGIYLPAGNGKVAFALRSELGEAMANVLLKEPFQKQIYNFTGNNTYSFYDIANVLTELSGKQVTYNNIENSVFSQMMLQRNVPEKLIDKVLDFITDIKNNQESLVTNDLETYLGRKPTPLKKGLKLLFNL